MSLPSPIAILRAVSEGVKNFLFAVVVLLVVVPIIPWVLIIGGVVLVVFKYWIIGIGLMLAGFVGRKLHKDLRI